MFAALLLMSEIRLTVMARPILGSNASLVVDPALLEKYQFSGPRYASYPTADRFTADFHPSDGLRELTKRGEAADRGPVSIHVHLPFCFCDTEANAGDRKKLIGGRRGVINRHLNSSK